MSFSGTDLGDLLIHNIISLQINFFILLHILYVLVKKIRNDGHHDVLRYLKAVKATLVLVPLLGIQFVIFPWRPHTKTLALVYDYVMHFLSHFQVRKPPGCAYSIPAQLGYCQHGRSALESTEQGSRCYEILLLNPELEAVSLLNGHPVFSAISFDCLDHD